VRVFIPSPSTRQSLYPASGSKTKNPHLSIAHLLKNSFKATFRAFVRRLCHCASAAERRIIQSQKRTSTPFGKNFEKFVGKHGSARIHSEKSRCPGRIIRRGPRRPEFPDAHVAPSSCGASSFALRSPVGGGGSLCLCLAARMPARMSRITRESRISRELPASIPRFQSNLEAVASCWDNAWITAPSAPTSTPAKQEAGIDRRQNRREPDKSKDWAGHAADDRQLRFIYL
jgi:hypothetical protein